jgi:hypothetical protein
LCQNLTLCGREKKTYALWIGERKPHALWKGKETSRFVKGKRQDRDY